MSDGRDSGGRFVAGANHPRQGGRNPSRRRIEPLLQRIGEEEIDTQDGKISKLEAVMRAVFGYALNGQSWAVQFIAERTEGKVRDAAPEADEVRVPVRLIEYDRPADG